MEQVGILAALFGYWARCRSRNNDKVMRIWFRTSGSLWVLLRSYLIYRSTTTLALIACVRWLNK